MPSSTSALDLSQIIDFPRSGLFATDDQNAGASASDIPASLAAVQSLSHAQLWDSVDWNMPGFPVLNHLQELAQTLVHWICESVMLSNHLILSSPSAQPSIFPSIRVFPSDSVLCKGGRSIGASASALEYSVLNFLYDWLIWSPCSPRDSQEYSPTPKFKNISLLVLSLLYVPTLTSIHDYWKNHSFD